MFTSKAINRALTAALVLLALAGMPQAHAAVTKVQTAEGSCTTSSGNATCTITFGSAVTSGDSVLYVYSCGQTSGTGTWGSITNNKSDTISAPAINYQATSTNLAGLLLVAGIQADVTSGPTVYTITTTHCDYITTQAWEVSGSNGTLDVEKHDELCGATACASPTTDTYTVAQSGEFAVMAAAPNPQTITSVTSWTIDQNASGGIAAEYASPPAGSNTLSFAWASGNNSIGYALISVEPSGSSGPTAQKAASMFLAN